MIALIQHTGHFLIFNTLDYLWKTHRNMEFNNGTGRRKNPIRRNSKFFSKEDFDLELEIGREYLEQDANQTVVLYEVDLEKTEVSDIYKEATKDGIRFKQPVEIPVVFKIDPAEVKAYDKQNFKGVYAKIGKLTFGVYIKTLEEYGCDIKRGDYIGVQVTPEHMEYFSVSDDGRVGSYANKNSMYGTRPYFRDIVAVPIDKNEFNG